jgi:RES domain-containing protein
VPRTWRVTKSKHAATAWDGEGASKHGGRWNNPGRRVVYTAFSRSLGALENLVHLGDWTLLQTAYVALPAEFDDDLVTSIGKAELGTDAHTYPSPTITRPIGDAWIERGTTPVLRVPTAVIPFALHGEPAEVNYLLNPLHRQFRRITRGFPLPFVFDPRLAPKKP